MHLTSAPWLVTGLHGGIKQEFVHVHKSHTLSPLTLWKTLGSETATWATATASIKRAVLQCLLCNYSSTAAEHFSIHGVKVV